MNEIVQNNTQSILKKRNRLILCSVCIATYRRPLLLEKLLKSLEKQQLSNDVNMEIIVVDNDANKSAMPIINKFQNSARITFAYFHQPQKNISLARNLGVEKANGQYIVFIDDDEVASTHWIINLYNTAKAYNADGVFGLVIPEFHPGAPQWIRQRDFYFRPMPSTGTEAKFTFSGNCLLKASLLKEIKELFDPQYGITGGGDTIFLEKLARQGAYFVNCREAISYEYMTPNRTTVSYLLRRSMKGGNTFSKKVINGSRSGKQFIIRIQLLCQGFSYSILCFVLIVFHFPFKVRRIKWMIKLAANIGKLMGVFNWYYRAYG